jgi:transposase
MLQITFEQNIFIATRAVDFRRGIDGLVATCRLILKNDPFSGHVFIFRNRSLTSVKVLTYDGKGFWLCQKRLSSGKFKRWPQSFQEVSVLSPVQVMSLLQ